MRNGRALSCKLSDFVKVGSTPTVPMILIKWDGWQSLVECTELETRHGAFLVKGSNPFPSGVSSILH